MPVPKFAILPERVAVGPVALVNTPLAAIAKLDEEVEKLLEDDAQTPLGEASFSARTR